MRIPAKWPDQLCELVHPPRELQDQNVSVGFGAEEETEGREEFGVIDAVLFDTDVGEELPPTRKRS